MPQPHAFSPRSPDEDGRTALVAQILTLLEHAVSGWQLPDTDWQRLDGPVDALTAAGADSDVPALRRALVQLQLAAPDRITPVTRSAVVSAPPRLRERVNHLVHTLRGSAEGSVPDHTPRSTDEPCDARDGGHPTRLDG
ncbi:CATRA system-associated protein [Streptomyces qinglanensis]|uniref:CATRA system-associated protein n=1 Tax=Streptomyces qinglanensis TaxID=943816 RepID=UPI003D7477C4